MRKIFVITKRRVFFYLLVIVGLLLLIFLIQQIKPITDIQPPSVLTYNVRESSFPNDKSLNFVLPALGRNPLDLINEHDKDLNLWFADKRTNPDSSGIRGGIYPASEMHENYDNVRLRSLWLPQAEPFRGVALLEPYFPTRNDESRQFILVGLLDGVQINLTTDNTPATSRIILNVKRGERRTVSFSTDAISQGVHNLSFFFFYYANDNNPDPLYQHDIGAGLNAHTFKVYVGTTNYARSINFLDLSIGTTPMPHIDHTFAINDYADGFIKDDSSYGIPLIWRKQNFKASELIEYTIVLTNGGSADREYCFAAFLDYAQITIKEDNLQICGIVRSGQYGLIRTSFHAPFESGNHHFEVISIENPLMKESYANALGRNGEEFSTYISSGRVLLKVDNGVPS